MRVADLPAINASLNLVSTIFIATGWYLIRRGHWRSHIACMVTAVHFFVALSRLLPDLSLLHGRKIDALLRRRRYRGHLFHDIDLAHPARLRHAAAGHHDARPGFSSPLGSSPAHRAMDDADLALRFGDGRACLPHALQMVPAAESCVRRLVDV